MQLLGGEVQLFSLSLQSAQLLAGLRVAVLHDREVSLQTVQGVSGLTDLRSAGKYKQWWRNENYNPDMIFTLYLTRVILAF